MVIYVGYLLFLFIGITLGLIGGGGSILTMPVLVYLYQLDPLAATTYSLFIVGSTSAFGVIYKWQSGLVDWKTALLFVFPSLVTVWLVRTVVIPLIPEILFKVEAFTLNRSTMLLLFFSMLMIVVALRMIRPSRNLMRGEKEMKSPIRILILGGITGLLTGFVGAGGGFIIIPALTIFTSMPMKKAVGTSLLIIALNALFGFSTDLLISDSAINWSVMLPILFFTLLGVLIGNNIAKKINQDNLKIAFGWFVLILGGYILIHELRNLFV